MENTEYLDLAKRIIEDYLADKFDVIGVRCLTSDQDDKTGADVRDSYDWDHEEDCSTYHTTGEMLDGASAVRVNCKFYDMDDVEELAEAIEQAVEASNLYIGSPVLIVGYGGMQGEDDDEIIIENAKVYESL